MDRLTERQTDRRMDICDSRVAFATENVTSNYIFRLTFCPISGFLSQCDHAKRCQDQTTKEFTKTVLVLFMYLILILICSKGH